MPSIGSVFLFAAGAAAQLTTSVWLPGGSKYADSYERYIDSFNASVIAKEGTKTVMALQSVIATATRGAYRATAQTMTLHGSTSFEFVTTFNSRVGYESTYSMGCSLAESTKAVCTDATIDPNMYSEYCGYYTSTQPVDIYTTTRRYTYSNPPQTVTQVYTSTETYRQNYRTPSACLSGSTLPESYYRTTYTVRPETYQVVVTAAAEKLTASSTPTSNSTVSSVSSSASGSGSTPSPGAPGSSGNNAPAPNQNAAPMVTLAPALAGLGAAAAAFFL
ncbi:hypothetical protein DM02DRAFT_635259 [Periconia macrospinosa]|uniref:Uncharacterized protein n=1 Tax=Periconia macrospinosa TaxID=97972 RepID=A0A2V1D4J5_9PLEO|nr:hypothetical protein DM02DRAFT_635259 [Periconia macrospinosa]